MKYEKNRNVAFFQLKRGTYLKNNFFGAFYEREIIQKYV